MNLFRYLQSKCIQFKQQKTYTQESAQRTDEPGGFSLAEDKGSQQQE